VCDLFLFLQVVAVFLGDGRIELNACVSRSGLYSVRITVDGGHVPLAHRCACTTVYTFIHIYIWYLFYITYHI